MVCGDFKTLNQSLAAFSLRLINQSHLFRQIGTVNPSPRLSTDLEDNLELAIAVDTEKARSELIIAPILLELRRQLAPNVSFFSGIYLTVDSERGLNGECDFILSASDNQLDVSAPIVTIVEAKNNDIKSGIGQCVAQMVGAQMFNQNDKPIIGAVTTGVLWRFLRLRHNILEVDLTEYIVPLQLEIILGILSSPFLRGDQE